MSNTSAGQGALLGDAVSPRGKLRPRSSAASKRWQTVVVTGLVFCALVSVFTTIGIILMLVVESWGFF